MLPAMAAVQLFVTCLGDLVFPEAVRDAHSLEMEVAAELGLPGLLALGMMICGTALAARRAMRAHAAAAAGPTAALLVWFLHASIDWDWQLPAVSLPAIALTGALIVLAEQPLTGGER